MKHQPSAIVIVNAPGHCRWCGCTDAHACAGGRWANPRRSLCSDCVPLDRALRSREGRRALAAFLQAHEFLVGATRPAAARPSAGRR